MAEALPDPTASRPATAEAGRSDLEPTPPERFESKAYGRRELACTLADMAVDVIYLGAMGLYGGLVVDRFLGAWSVMECVWLRLTVLFVVTMAGHYVLAFPLSVYSGFTLEHQFGLSRQTFGRWLRRYLLQQTLVLALGLLLVLGLFAIIWWTGPWWWLVAAAATFVVTVVLGQLFPVWILPLFYKIERLRDDDLMRRFQRLTRGTSLQVEGVYRMRLSSETVKANALLAGLGRTRRVILGDTLLDQFQPEEIEVVLAHEIGHHVYHHIPKLVAWGMLSTAAGFWIADAILTHWITSLEGSFDYAQFPVYALPMLMFVMTTFSLLFSPLRNTLSRHFEIACDRYALQATGNPGAFRSAFAKLARLNKADIEPHPWEVLLLHDHPPIARRLALAEEYAVPRNATP